MPKHQSSSSCVRRGGAHRPLLENGHGNGDSQLGPVSGVKQQAFEGVRHRLGSPHNFNQLLKLRIDIRGPPDLLKHLQPQSCLSLWHNELGYKPDIDNRGCDAPLPRSERWKKT